MRCGSTLHSLLYPLGVQRLGGLVSQGTSISYYPNTYLRKFYTITI